MILEILNDGVTKLKNGIHHFVLSGGILAQIESNTMGTAGTSWQDILRHYYTRNASVSYYNSHMNYGTLIIASAHTHDWGSGTTCTNCGAIAK